MGFVSHSKAASVKRPRWSLRRAAADSCDIKNKRFRVEAGLKWTVRRGWKWMVLKVDDLSKTGRSFAPKWTVRDTFSFVNRPLSSLKFHYQVSLICAVQFFHLGPSTFAHRLLSVVWTVQLNPHGSSALT